LLCINFIPSGLNPHKTLNLPLQKHTIDMSFRTEHDTMGAVQVPADKYWGAQTERSRNNFKIGPEASMPKEIIEAFAFLKKAAAYTNTDLGVLTCRKTRPDSTGV
jgi:aspartate ammonia-lyase